MIWENGKLKVTCPKIMWIPDEKANNETGKTKQEIQRPKLTNV